MADKEPVPHLDMLMECPNRVAHRVSSYIDLAELMDYTVRLGIIAAPGDLNQISSIVFTRLQFNHFDSVDRGMLRSEAPLKY